jgi:hypothetical protein
LRQPADGSDTIPSLGLKERPMFFNQGEAAKARLLGLDVVEWSLLFGAIGLTGLAVVLA